MRSFCLGRRSGQTPVSLQTRDCPAGSLRAQTCVVEPNFVRAHSITERDGSEVHIRVSTKVVSMRREAATRRSWYSSNNPRSSFFRQVQNHHRVAIFIQEEREWIVGASFLKGWRREDRLHRLDKEVRWTKGGKRSSEVTAIQNKDKTFYVE